MAYSLISMVNEQVQSIIQQEFRLNIGLNDELEKISITLTAIQGVLKVADKRQVQEGDVKVWLDELKDISYSIDDVLDEWSTRNLGPQIEVADTSALVRKVCTYFRCFCLDEDVLHRIFFCLPGFGFNQLIFRQKVAHSIKAIRNRLDWIAEEKSKYHFDIGESSSEEPERIITSSVVNISTVIGRALDKEVIISKLLSESSHLKEGLPVISIVGMGGLGKTTLAQLVFNDAKVKTHFDKKIWVCVSDPFDKIRVAKEIIGATGQHIPDFPSWDALHQCLCQSIEGKLFLLVLDDMWTEEGQKWDPFKDALEYGAPGSRIIVTTRSERVAVMMGSAYIHNLKTLSEDDSWALLSGKALFGRVEEEQKELEEIGKKIALKCKGLPLATRTLGGLLRFKRKKSEWLDVLESETWKSQGFEKNVFPALLLSYYDLPSHLKCCFAYCAVFQKNKIYREVAIRMWMAQGFLGSHGEEDMERVGGEYFDNLVTRSLLHSNDKNYLGRVLTYGMHDFVHDLVQFVMGKECLVVEKNARSRVLELHCSTKTRHLTLLCDNIEDIIPLICKAVNLRTLCISDGPEFCSRGLFPVLFCNLTCLRSLDLNSTKIEEVPSEIEKLIHLRYLDISRTKIKELPETVSNLHNLQTLDLQYCKELVKLPEGIVNLRKMRHLQIRGTSSLTYLPQGIGRLSSLKILGKFIVGGNVDGCKISELQNLNDIRGSLEITGLGNVRSNEEARELDLSNKRQIKRLFLAFDGNPSVAIEGNEMCQTLLRGFQPPVDLEMLVISEYPNTMFPKDWMTGDGGLALSSNLRILGINNCRNCLRLFLPKLPSVEILQIRGFELARYMGPKFFGITDDDDVAETREMPDGNDVEDDEDDIMIMPNLYHLALVDCCQLMVLPRHLSHRLKVLWVWECPALKWTSSCLLLPVLEELNLVGDVGALSRSLAPTRISLPALKSLRIIRSLHSSLPEGLCHLTALKVLKVDYCDRINSLTEELQHLNTIQELRIRCSFEREREITENLSTLLHIPHIYIQDKFLR